MMQHERTVHFVPGNDQNRIDSVIDSDADIAALDLEDIVIPSEKDNSLENIRSNIDRWHDVEQNVGVRINGLYTERGLNELTRLLEFEEYIDYLIIPDVRKASEIEFVCEILDEVQSSLRLMVFIETAESVMNLKRIAHTEPDRLHSLVIGAADLTLDMDMSIFDDPDFTALRALVPAAAKSANIRSYDLLNFKLNDDGKTKKESRQAKKLGYDGKLVLGDDQTRIVNDIFSPSAKDVNKAKEIIKEFEDHTRDENDGMAMVDGRLVDKPVILQMQKLLRLAGEEPIGPSY